MLENIEYLPIKKEFHVGDVKNLAVMTEQKEYIKNSFPKEVKTIISNADMLSQNFDNMVNVSEVPKVESVNNPVQVTSIPSVQNSFNMEANPVDLSVNPIPVTPVIDNTLNSIPVSQTKDVVEPNLNIPTIEPINPNPIVENNDIVNQTANSTIENVIPVNGNSDISSNVVPQVDNTFKVSDQPNIFDNPTNAFSISQEEINKPLENSASNNILPETNIFAQPVNSNPVLEEKIEKNNFKSEYKENVENSLNDDFVMAQIAIEESNVKYYEALAENSKKKIELLKRQMKNVVDDNVNLENTASDLFNSNGLLDDEKVLAKTSMPNIMVA